MTTSKTAKGGRPSVFRPEFVEQAKKLCAFGATDMEIADFFKVNVLTIHRWKHVHPEFCNALKAGKAAADDRVERSLFNRAVGYTFDSEKIVTVSDGKDGSHIERVPIKEHVPPSETAMIFWLKNRRRDQWRDRVDNVHTGKDDGPIEVIDPTAKANAIGFALRKGMKHAEKR